MHAEQSELGKKTHYESHYDPSILFPIERGSKRHSIGISDSLPFFGYDLWNHYEVSWLNDKGKPIVALAEIVIGCGSKNIIESKSMKLYFNSFNNTHYRNVASLTTTIEKDLAERLNTDFISVRITPLSQVQAEPLLPRLSGICIDELDIACSVYQTDPTFLQTDNEWVEETLYSDLLKSNCLVTNQPDWCSVQIAYKGQRINHESLLKYIVSFRNSNEFHEHCIEKIFMQILERCHPSELTVTGRSTRRGGVDINSLRSTQPVDLKNTPNPRLCRQ